MRSIAAFALVVLLFSTASRAADPAFAVSELERYLKPIDPVGRVQVEVVIDRKLDPHPEFSIATEAGRLKLTATDPYMTLVGVYHLLDHLGFRFLAPNLAHYNGSAEVAPKSLPEDFKLDAPIVRKPKLRFRKLYVEEGHSHDEAGLKAMVEWMPKVGYNVLVVPTDYQGSGRVKWDHWRDAITPELQKRGIIIEVGGHGYQNFLNADMHDGELFNEHPDWFGMDETGQRTKAKNRVFCTTNEAAVRFVTDQLLAYLKLHPEIQIYDFWPPDGAKWCQCEACGKLGDPPDRQAILLRQVQEKVRPIRPDLRLEVIAYASCLNPSANQAIDNNVLVDFCPIAQRFDAQINETPNATYSTALRTWRQSFAGDISVYSYYRKYAWDSLPVTLPHYMRMDLQWYASLPVQGVSTYAEPGDWFTYELNHYALAHLAWDPDADVDAIVRKFCDARYGDESAVAQSAMTTLENCVRNYCSIPHVPLKPADEIRGALVAMQKTTDAVTEAQSRETDQSIRRNLGRLKLICTYALRDLEIQTLRATGADAGQIEAKATALHRFLESNADQGVFLMRGGRLSVKRMLARYGVVVKSSPD